jgi:methylenetetrahydrofolate dehydrogenase (NADP+)/methenyltetrahydrofolate cyclohydrolase
VSARIIDGKAVAGTLRAQLRARIGALAFQPGLAVVLVGNDTASAVYVRAKDRAAREAGIAVRTIRLPADVTEAAVLSEIARLNADPAVDGILVQLPLPPHIRTQAVVEAVDPAKDVDGFHPLNIGRLAAGVPFLVPCTPLGVMRLLEAAGTNLSGARAIVVGRSTIVGRPLAALLLHADATVTLAHSRTRDLPAECRRAEVLIAAVGKAEMVRGDWIHPGAAVIDVGVNRRPDGRLVGDVAFAECAAVAGAITPVPGGVGPMTIACLLENTLTAALSRRGSAPRRGLASHRPSATVDAAAGVSEAAPTATAGDAQIAAG